MSQPVSAPNGCFARLVMALVLLTALIILAATVLFLLAILPLPDALRPGFGLIIFLAASIFITWLLLRRASEGEDAIRQQMDALFAALGLSLQERGAQAGTYASVYQGHALQADYAISGTPQRPTYHLEIAVRQPAPFRLAIGMAKFQLQFDEAQFGLPLPLFDPDYAHLITFTDDPERAYTLMSAPEVKRSILHLLSPDAPGVRNLTLTEEAVVLRFRHHSFKRLDSRLVQSWLNDLCRVVWAPGVEQSGEKEIPGEEGR